MPLNVVVMLKIFFFMMMSSNYEPPPKAYVCDYFGSGCKCEEHGPMFADNPPPIELPGSESTALKRQTPLFDYNLYVAEMGSVVGEVVSSLDWSGLIEVRWEFGPSISPKFRLAYSPGLGAESVNAITNGLRNLPVFRTAGVESSFSARFEICGHKKQQLKLFRA